jgi:hypothetical protein
MIFGSAIDQITRSVYNTGAMRESPSGKASAFQADIRRFESGLPLMSAETKEQERKSIKFRSCFFILFASI